MVHSANNDSLIDVENLPAADRYCVAFSGGVDSTALLIAMAQIHSIKDKLFAVHINHQIQDEANDWALHCAEVCQNLKVSLVTETVTPKSHSEDACRHARLVVFKELLTESDCLLTAHHADDQVETILFRLLRGTGTSGLKGMDITSALFGYQHHRPFLSLMKSKLKQFVVNHNIKHINDNSNSNTTYRRNFIRNKIIPEINNYDKRSLQNIKLTSHNINNSHKLLNHLIGNDNPLSTHRFNSKELLSTALYHWLGNLCNDTSASQNQLLQFASDCLSANADKNSQLELGTANLIHWQDQVYALNPLPTVDLATEHHQLTSNKQLALSSGTLILISNEHLYLDITIAYQQSGQNITLPNHKISKKVKNLFQEKTIPPWVRKQIPYIYVDGELISVGSIFIAESFQMFLDKNNAQFEWLSPQFLL